MRTNLTARDNVEPVGSALFQALKAISENRFTEAALGEALDAEVWRWPLKKRHSPRSQISLM